MDTFKELKEEIIKRAKEKNACVNAFKKACESETIEQLMEVVKNNFNWCCCNILDANFINKYKSEFNKNNIFCNESVNSGYLLVTDTCTIYGNDNCTINGYDKCTIEGNSNCTINGYDKCTIEGNGNCTINGNDNCTIYGNGNCTINGNDNCTIYGNGNCTIYGNDNCTIYGNDNCTINGYDKCTIEGNGNCTINGYDKCTIEGNGNCTIYGNDNCYIYSYSIKECKLNNNAIYRVIETNTIYYASDNIKFEKLNN